MDSFFISYIINILLLPQLHNLPYEQVGENEPVCIADQVLFEIPESWEWVRLSHIFAILNGDRGKNYPAKSTLSSEGIPFISALNLNGKSVVKDENLLCVTEKQYNKLGNGKLVKGDIVVCIRGSLGKHGKYPFDRGAIASSLVILRSFIDEENLYNYIMIWLDSPLFFSEIKKYDNGTAQPNLAAKSLEQFFVPLPPVAEQERIVKKNEELLSYIEKYEKSETQQEKLKLDFPEMLKKSILQEAVQGKLVLQDPADVPASVLLKCIHTEKQKLIAEGKVKKGKHESVIFKRDNSHYEIIDGVERCIDEELPFEIPESWAWCRWGTLSTSIQYGYNAPAQNQGRIRMVRISDIQDNKVLWDFVPFCNIDEMEIDTYKLEPGDILFARTGGTVGKSYLVQDVPVEAVYAGYLIRTRYSKVLSSKYLKFFMESGLYWNQLRAGTIATAQPNCNGKTLSRLLLPVPPASEQFRIAQKVQELLSICDQLLNWGIR